MEQRKLKVSHILNETHRETSEGISEETHEAVLDRSLRGISEGFP